MLLNSINAAEIKRTDIVYTPPPSTAPSTTNNSPNPSHQRSLFNSSTPHSGSAVDPLDSVASGRLNDGNPIHRKLFSFRQLPLSCGAEIASSNQDIGYLQDTFADKYELPEQDVTETSFTSHHTRPNTVNFVADEQRNDAALQITTSAGIPSDLLSCIKRVHAGPVITKWEEVRKAYDEFEALIKKGRVRDFYVHPVAADAKEFETLQGPELDRNRDLEILALRKAEFGKRIAIMMSENLELRNFVVCQGGLHSEAQVIEESKGIDGVC